MKNLMIGGVAAALLSCATAAGAQMFTYEITWGEVDMVGGIGASGDMYQGGSVEGTYVSTYAGGEENSGTVRCVGMDQPPNSMFAIHLACNAEGDSSLTGIAYGCNYLGEPGPETPLGCVGGMHGKSGEMDGRFGSVTMHWFSATEARGTGQWYAQ